MNNEEIKKFIKNYTELEINKPQKITYETFYMLLQMFTKEVNKNCNLQSVSQQRELLVAYDNFKLMSPQSFCCSEECIDAFLATNWG